MKLRVLSFSTCLAVLLGLSACTTTSTPSGSSDPQGERLAQAYHILAKCDHDPDDHVGHAMDLTKDAARILGTDVDHDGVQDIREGDCLQHLQNAREMIRLARAGLPVTGEKRALVTAGAALREVNAAIDDRRR